MFFDNMYSLTTVFSFSLFNHYVKRLAQIKSSFLKIVANRMLLT